jgi:hypothetical protein
MALTIKKNKIYFAILAMCLVVPYCGSYEITFLLWSFTALITIQFRYSLTFIKYLSSFILVLLIAFFNTKFDFKNLFLIIRDITYLLKPILGLVVGYQICKYNYDKGFLSIIKIGFFVSVTHIFFILHSIIYYNAYTVNAIREYSGFFSDFEVYALILLLFHKKFNVELSKIKFYAMFVTIAFSSFMYLSRGNFIQFVILLLALKGVFILNKKAIIAIVSFVLVSILAYSIILYINPKRNGNGIEALLYKIKIAPTEPFKTKIKTDDYIDFNDNYRSVETINTLAQMSNKSNHIIVLGDGLGSTIDLHREVYLGNLEIRYISIMHNAFMTTYLKSGVLGVFILLFSIGLLFFQPKSNIPINHNINQLLAGTAVFLLISNWVLMGYYFSEDSKSLLVGFFISYREITNRLELTKSIS